MHRFITYLFALLALGMTARAQEAYTNDSVPQASSGQTQQAQEQQKEKKKASEILPVSAEV